jgi:hypothetical protein
MLFAARMVTCRYGMAALRLAVFLRYLLLLRYEMGG